MVIASVHQNLKMSEEKATERLLKAIENPYTHILGHLTGRLLLGREGYPLNMKRIIEACAAHQVAIELNCNPHRLDLDWRWLKACKTAGVKIVLSPDAHSVFGFEDLQYGLNLAKKGFLTANDILNTESADFIIHYFSHKTKQNISKGI